MFSIFIVSGCGGQKVPDKNVTALADTTSMPDTGYTGIKQYFYEDRLIKEVSLVNGVRNGPMKSFYSGGQIRQSFLYKDGLREDTARWFYVEGQVFRTTPYRRDTIHGIQQQYFKSGRIKARLGYEKGFRNFFFEEFSSRGSLIKEYPRLVIDVRDDYSTNGTYKIMLSLSDSTQKVKYFRGDFSGGVFDTLKAEPVNTIDGYGYLTLRKASGSTNADLEILAEILTGYGNNYLLVKKIELPYVDLR